MAGSHCLTSPACGARRKGAPPRWEASRERIILAKEAPGPPTKSRAGLRFRPGWAPFSSQKTKPARVGAPDGFRGSRQRARSITSRSACR
ncbi:hypothetical protein HMPREF9440_02514 [Sutterella parvirubra YIT 11816]|uniref:Uncharacterized protein n=1 Tax=Sutterella parvirubra YIT 11816 TaxID=762967 RepID=H3KIA6_9BURK|nr:hypothetical protein HMPREF9440_02514 [Sutterella parvirubra YIT 11816]